jgi:hypothetical protein
LEKPFLALLSTKLKVTETLIIVALLDCFIKIHFHKEKVLKYRGLFFFLLKVQLKVNLERNRVTTIVVLTIWKIEWTSNSKITSVFVVKKIKR